MWWRTVLHEHKVIGWITTVASRSGHEITNDDDVTCKLGRKTLYNITKRMHSTLRMREVAIKQIHSIFMCHPLYMSTPMPIQLKSSLLHIVNFVEM